MEQAATVLWHTLGPEQVAGQLAADPVRGLSGAEAARRLAADGPNALTETRAPPWWHTLLQQFRSLIVLLLVVATAVALLLGDQLEAAAIMVVIVLNATIGFATEHGAQRALAALRQHVAQAARVIRDGSEQGVPASELVVGDLVVLEAGAVVPADGRITEATRLQIDEAILTGESQPVDKSIDSIPDTDLAMGDRLNLAYLGTAVTDGRGLLIVTATGPRTEVGKIGRMVEEADSPSSTPLDRELDRLGRVLVVAVLVLCGLIAVLGWLRGLSELGPMLELAVSLAIAAVPEGLPAVATMTLAIGMRRMAKRRALIRRLPAVETLGSTTVICTDKTGTLTRNEMTVTTLALHQRRISVTGTGYEHDGDLQEEHAPSAEQDALLPLAIRIGTLCNNAALEESGTEIRVLGDPTEAALLVLARKAGVDRDRLEQEFPRIAEQPFSADTRRMATIHRTPDGGRVVLIKGSPGAILKASNREQHANGPEPLDAAGRERWTTLNTELASSALRVLALAWRELSDGDPVDAPHSDLIFVGLVGMLDPLRDEARPAVEACRKAGIRVIMLTGDQLATAVEIGRQLGIDHDASGQPLQAVHARDLGAEGSEAAASTVARASVFARISPAHKLQIIAALQGQGQVVAMTGDGVNDAPALQQADIGVAMGIKGTDVAREACDMVLTDDNFATITAAVEQGRVVHANIVRFIQYLLSCNLSEILVVASAIAMGLPFPLAALQILWLNMITDVFPAMSLALEPSDPKLMGQPPRNAKVAILDAALIRRIAGQGVLLAGVTMVAFAVGLTWHDTDGEGLRRASTMAFMTLALSQVVHVFNARSPVESAFDRGVLRNPWLWLAVATCLGLQWLAVSLPLLQLVLHTVMPTMAEWLVIAGCALLPVVVIEVMKLVRRRATGDG